MFVSVCILAITSSTSTAWLFTCRSSGMSAYGNTIVLAVHLHCVSAVVEEVDAAALF